MTLDSLVARTWGWAHSVGLNAGTTTPQKQLEKTIEEAGEAIEAFDRGDLEAAAMEMGGVLVTAIVACLVARKFPDHCLSMALMKIGGRKGTVVDGKFVKEE